MGGSSSAEEVIELGHLLAKVAECHECSVLLPGKTFLLLVGRARKRARRSLDLVAFPTEEDDAGFDHTLAREIGTETPFGASNEGLRNSVLEAEAR